MLMASREPKSRRKDWYAYQRHLSLVDILDDYYINFKMSATHESQGH